MLMSYTEEREKVKHDSNLYGVPGLRFVEASRSSLGGVEEADKVMQPLLDALTRPLTDKEKQRGRWAPTQPRILFEGTLPEAEEFYQQTENIPGILNVPYAVYTDGMPIVIPTEERVAAMLKGTSHKPDEVITLQKDIAMRGVGNIASAFTRKKGDVVQFMPMFRTATVEQVAVNAVMAGCKPEMFPVALAMAESGGGTADGRGWGGAFLVSGPIYKEIGMNVSYGRLGPGNPANKNLGRLGSLMNRNLGGYCETITGIGVGMSYGNPLTNGGFMLAEYSEGLPPGWKGLNEELGFKKDESVLMTFAPSHWGLGQEHMPGVYRSFQRTGHGAIARYLDVKGVPGPHNYLEYLTIDMWACRDGGFTLLLPPQVARDLYDFGFKTKEAVYDFLWKKSFIPMSEFRMRGRSDILTNGWTGKEKRSGKFWKELPDDYMVPVGGDDPNQDYNVIVCDGQETAVDRLGGGKGPGFSIDAWR